MVLSVIMLALNEDSKTDVNKLLSSTGDKRNIAGLFIWHPILLDSPFEEPPGKDQLLDDLLLRKHSYTVSQANS